MNVVKNFFLRFYGIYKSFKSILWTILLITYALLLLAILIDPRTYNWEFSEVMYYVVDYMIIAAGIPAFIILIISSMAFLSLFYTAKPNKYIYDNGIKWRRKYHKVYVKSESGKTPSNDEMSVKDKLLKTLSYIPEFPNRYYDLMISEGSIFLFMRPLEDGNRRYEDYSQPPTRLQFDPLEINYFEETYRSENLYLESVREKEGKTELSFKNEGNNIHIMFTFYCTLDIPFSKNKTWMLQYYIDN